MKPVKQMPPMHTLDCSACIAYSHVLRGTGLTGATASLVGGLLISGAGFLTVGAVGLALGVVPLILALRLREPEPGQYEF